jgi:hypothetical protein
MSCCLWMPLAASPQLEHEAHIMWLLWREDATSNFCWHNLLIHYYNELLLSTWRSPRHFLHCIDLRISSQSLQQPTSGPCTEPPESSPHPPKIQFNIILLTRPSHSGSMTISACICHLSHACHMPCLPLPWFDCHNIWWSTQLKKLLNMQFFPAPVTSSLS